MEIKKCLLLDFNFRINSRRVLKSSIISSLNKINNRDIFGEIDPSPSLGVSMTNITHSIKNLILEDNKIYGDVRFLSTHMGKNVIEIFNSGITPKFKIRWIGENISDKIFIKEIITWDLCH
jgi:hypothetical protein